jgi:hypothetical protein
LSRPGHQPFAFELPDIYLGFALDSESPLASYDEGRFDSGSSSTLGTDSPFLLLITREEQYFWLHLCNQRVMPRRMRES